MILASMFLTQIGVVGGIFLFHLLLIVLVVPRVARYRRRSVTVGALALVLLLDLPLVHAFVLYKHFHPHLLDVVMHAIARPLVVAHLTLGLVGGGFLMVQLVRQIVRRLRPAQEPVREGAGVPPPGRDPELSIEARRRFLWKGGLALAGVASGATTLMAADEAEFITEQVVIRIPGLPEGLRGTTIAMISDVHSSVYMTRSEMERYVAALNAMKADMAVVVGDFVNARVREVYPFGEAFSRLEAPLGVYGVTGNHDYYTKEIETVAREVEGAGIKLLRNENLVIERNGERLWLMGVDDADIYEINGYLEEGKTERGIIENMVAGIPEGAPRLMLCHKPYPFEEYSRLGIDLMLSGHTHGGQVVLGKLDSVNLSFASLASNYLAGLYLARANDRSQLYVTRGVGTVGIPMRLNCPPEITRVVLV